LGNASFFLQQGWMTNLGWLYYKNLWPQTLYLPLHITNIRLTRLDTSSQLYYLFSKFLIVDSFFIKISLQSCFRLNLFTLQIRDIVAVHIFYLLQQTTKIRIFLYDIIKCFFCCCKLSWLVFHILLQVNF
jgi:hypothetical protein